MKRWIRLAILVLTSAWLFPVSCTGALFAGTQIVAEMDARKASAGEPLHDRFQIVKETGNPADPFSTHALDGLEEQNEYMALLKEHEELTGRKLSRPGASYLISQASGSFEDGASSFSFHVIEETNAWQVIELRESYRDGDNTIWSRYRATESTITPISSRMFYFGYLFAAFPYAIGFALLLPLSGWLVRRKLGAQQQPG